MHQEAWLNAPMDHINNIHNSSLGTLHPLYLTLLIYGVLYGVRKLFAAIAKRFKKEESTQ